MSIKSGKSPSGDAAAVNRTILHVDMDAFYASIEQRDHPEYRGRPLIVGSDPKDGKGRGIVATCSYEARKFGVHSAQPISQAWRLCPRGVYVRPDMDKYSRVSSRIMNILLEFTDMLEQVSVDEAFLDVSGSEKLLGTGVEIALKIKSRIKRDLGLTASVGVASNKFVAKVASDLEKPDGLVVVAPGGEKEFLAPLEIGRLWGVGPKTESVLKAAGLEKIGQIAALSQSEMTARIGRRGEQLWQLSQGVDSRPVEPGEGCKSIGHEITFEQDTGDLALIETTLLDLSERVAHRLRNNGFRARTIALKFRESDFSTCVRRVTLSSPADTSEKIFPEALKLLKNLFRKGISVRLVGVSAGNLEASAGEKQMSLFDPKTPKDRKLAAALDDISRRFGRQAITRAALAPKSKG